MNAPNKLDYEALLRSGKGVMEIMGKEGDTKSIWDPTKPDEVDAAKAQFDALKKKGYIAFRVNEKGDKGEIMTAFDPTAGRVILAPVVAGG